MWFKKDNRNAKMIEVGAEASILSIKGKTTTFSDNDVVTLTDIRHTGRIVVTDEDNNDSAIFTVHVESDVPVVAKEFGDSKFTVTQGADNGVNVYVAGGEVTIESTITADTKINYKLV